jgi:hypothetical protein
MRHQITISMVDAQSGLKGFKAFVDGHYVAFDQVPKSPWVRCDLTETPVRRTGSEASVEIHRLGSKK